MVDQLRSSGAEKNARATGTAKYEKMLGLPENMRIFLLCGTSATKDRLDRGRDSDGSRRVADAMMMVIW